MHGAMMQKDNGTDVQSFLINAMKRSMKMECESFHLVPHFSPHGHSKSILLRVERQWVVRRWSTEIDRDQLKLLKRMWREKYVWSWVCCFYHIAFRLFRDLDSCLFESCKLPSCLARKRCFAVPCVSTTCAYSLTFHWIMLVTVI